MGRYQRELLTVRVPPGLRQAIRDLAGREGLAESVVVRDLLSAAVRKRIGAHAADPLQEALHAVLPKYFKSLHDLVAAARYDAVMARELATSAAFAALLATGRSESQAREILNNTVGRATKVAARRMHQFPEPLREGGGVTDAATGAQTVPVREPGDE